LAKGENIDVYAEFRVMAAQIKVEAEIAKYAKVALERMLALP
jgi:quinolinate synthase